MATRKTAAKKKTRRRKASEADSRGLPATQLLGGEAPEAVAAVARRIAAADGTELCRYRDPLGGSWLVLAALPLAAVAPTPFQRDLSEAHVKRLEGVIEAVGVFLDPVVAVAAPDDAQAPFWTPNGLHRLSALRRMGARTVTALIGVDPALAYRILALNTEKAHNTKERSLEAVRMARGLAALDPARHESDFALELEDGSLVTLGFAYEAKARFAGGAYAAVLKASDAFLEVPLPDALQIREARARRLLAIDERVAEISEALKRRGFESPYLRNFVVARIRPFRGRGRPAPDADALLEHMAAAAAKFDVGKVRESQVTKAGGAAD